VEGSATFVRCIVTYLLIDRSKYGLVSFGWAQVLYGCVLVLGYFGYFSMKILFSKDENSKKIPLGSKDENSKKIPLDSIRQLFPTRSHFVGPQLRGLYWVYLWQSVEKLVLTEGEKFVLWGYTSFINQGIYSVVNNLGSLVVRFLFQPIEEICFSLFSKLLANSQETTDLNAAAHILRCLTKFMIIIGLIFIALGPNYSSLLLNTLYLDKFKNTAAANVLSWYCGYVAVIAINGITEAFVHSVASPTQLRNYNILLITFSFIYVVAAILLLGEMGTSGLILANCLNMALRVAFSVYFIRKYYREHNIRFSFSSLLPNMFEWAVLIAAYVITTYTQQLGFLQHLGAGVVCGLTILFTIYITDKSFCRDLYLLLVKKTLKQD